MVTWEYFKSRRRINVDLMIKKHNLTTYELFCAHLKKIEVLPPADETVRLKHYPTPRKRPPSPKEKLGIKPGTRRSKREGAKKDKAPPKPEVSEPVTESET